MAALPKSGLSLAEFQGKWTLSRVITDRRANAEGVLSGAASFTPDEPGRMIYEESGTLSYARQPPMAATRRYIWTETEEGIEVTFETGKSFHTIMLDRLMPDAIHLCDPDLYNVSYDFTRWPKWSSTWSVVGPRKDYKMVSDYLRTD